MSYQDLLANSKIHLSRFPGEQKTNSNTYIFTEGARWMTQRLNELDGGQRHFDPLLPYERYGYFKYIFCLSCFLLSAGVFWTNAIFLIPLAVVVFYFFEIHLLFLFPLLIGGVDHPIAKSIRMTYQIGIFTTLKTIIPIGVFMVLGLFRRQHPLKNWYLGCLAVLIWYVDERDEL